MRWLFKVSKVFSSLFKVKLRQTQASVGYVCLIVFPVTYVLSGGFASSLLAVYISALYTCGLAGLLIMFNSQFMKPNKTVFNDKRFSGLSSDKRFLDLVLGAFFVFMSYAMLEASYWILPQLSHIGGS